VHEKTLMRQSGRYAAETDVDAALSDELDTHIHQVPHGHHPSSYTQSEPQTAGPIPLSESQQGPRSFQPAENHSIHKQNPAVNTSIAHDPYSTSINTASRSRSVKDKVRELEERVERAKADT